METNNICIGKNAGLLLTTGHHNILIGDYAGCELITESFMFVNGEYSKKMTIDEWNYIFNDIICRINNYKPTNPTGNSSTEIGNSNQKYFPF